MGQHISLEEALTKKEEKFYKLQDYDADKLKIPISSMSIITFLLCMKKSNLDFCF